jgi:hypothetical protein
MEGVGFEIENVPASILVRAFSTALYSPLQQFCRRPVQHSPWIDNEEGETACWLDGDQVFWPEVARKGVKGTIE